MPANVMYFRLKAGVNFNPGAPKGPSLPPTPNPTTCVNSQTGKSKQSRRFQNHSENNAKYIKKSSLAPRSSVDDLLRHTPEAVNESSTLEEEEVANNLDHTNR